MDNKDSTHTDVTLSIRQIDNKELSSEPNIIIHPGILLEKNPLIRRKSILREVSSSMSSLDSRMEHIEANSIEEQAILAVTHQIKPC